MADDIRHNGDELAAIEAELQALGEEGLDAEELKASHDFGDAVEFEAPEGGPIEGLSILRLRSASASLSADRAALLGAELLSRVGARGPDEIRRELEGLDEPDLSAVEWDSSRSLGAVADALESSDALAEASDSLVDPAEIAGPLAALAVLRTSAASLTDARSAELYREMVERGGLASAAPSNVVPLRPRRRSGWALVFAAAAAILLVIAAAAILGVTHDKLNSPSPAVAQIELVHAEQELNQAETSALKTLMTAQTAPAGSRRGDHFLRSLRQARSDASRARRQARVRRL